MMQRAEEPGGGGFARWTVVLVLFSISAVHSLFPGRVTLDWPTVVLVCISVFLIIAPKLGHLLPLLKRLKIGQAEIELQAKAEEVAESVEKSEARAIQSQVSTAGASSPEARSADQRLLDTTEEAQIIKLASADRLAAILMLAIEIERELLFLA